MAAPVLANRVHGGVACGAPLRGVTRGARARAEAGKRDSINHHLLEVTFETETVPELRQKLLYTTPSGWCWPSRGAAGGAPSTRAARSRDAPERSRIRLRRFAWLNVGMGIRKSLSSASRQRSANRYLRSRDIPRAQPPPRTGGAARPCGTGGSAGRCPAGGRARASASGLSSAPEDPLASPILPVWRLGGAYPRVTLFRCS